MGSCSTHHIIVTKRMMARKKANRKARMEKRTGYLKGKFGDFATNRLADRFKTKNSLIKRTKTDLSLHRILDILFIAVVFIVALSIAYYVVRY